MLSGHVDGRCTHLRSSTLVDDDRRAGGVEDAMRLRPGLAVLRRGATSVQVGTDPRWAVVLADLSPAAVRALTSARRGAEERELRAALEGEHVDGGEVDAVLAHLRAARLLVDVPAPASDAVDGMAWSLLAADGDGRVAVGRRPARKVRVVGHGRVASAVASTLAVAGVGTVQVEADGPVSRHEAGVGGLTARDVGSARAAAGRRALQDGAPGVRTTVRGRPDLVILVEAHAADPLHWRPLHDDDVAHLSVVLREASVLVGPLVRPGLSSCLRCADLHRTDRDEAWPALAAQLVTSGPGHPAEEAALAAVAGALAAAQALAHLDGRPTAVDGAALEVSLPAAMPRDVEWPVHPDCGCTGL